MHIEIEPGKYIVAVSGGVDSVVLLDLLAKHPELELIVAHFDHGIRADSADDRKFVEKLAAKYKLSFEFAEGKLGANASEETARSARYEFLQTVLTKNRARAIITAHQQDDIIETMSINLLRGTGRKGLTSLSSRDHLLRPLLKIPKHTIVEYAKANNLEWHEDSTNQETKYLRNWVRQKVASKLTPDQKQQLLSTYRTMSATNQQLDKLLDSIIGAASSLDKKQLIMLPHTVALEVVAHWLRTQGVADFDSAALERIVIGAKTRADGKLIEIKKGMKVRVEAQNIKIIRK